MCWRHKTCHQGPLHKDQHKRCGSGNTTWCVHKLVPKLAKKLSPFQTTPTLLADGHPSSPHHDRQDPGSSRPTSSPATPHIKIASDFQRTGAALTTGVCNPPLLRPRRAPTPSAELLPQLNFNREQGGCADADTETVGEVVGDARPPFDSDIDWLRCRRCCPRFDVRVFCVCQPRDTASHTMT